MSAPAPSIDAALIRWRNNLIDLTRRNPLLALKTTRSGLLDITAPDADAVFDHLVVKNKQWTFYLPPAKDADKSKPAPPAKAGELTTSQTERQRLLQILTNLYRRARADFRERGLHILHLALGVLEWRDSDEEPMRSPLVLVPVELKRKSLQEPFILDWIDEDEFLNPALDARLKQEFDFKLPPLPEDWTDKRLSAYFDEVDKVIGGLPGWKLDRSALLSLFSFFKGVIFRDLEDNAEQVREHDIVKGLAGLPTTFKKADVPTERELDDKQDPAHSYHILDADGSQRLCLEAAAREESFVLIGPPGTGKSQTIANLIAEHLARGKRVLFVSEKMAALEVVFNRLKHVGLGDFCLELHSHKASKRAVITELARTLQDRAAAKAASSWEFASTLRDRRDHLNRYVRALHQVREPMRRSAWDALAELPRYHALLALALGLADPAAVTHFTAAQLDDLKQLLQRLQRLWHIREDKGYPWRGFKAERFTMQLRDEVVGMIDKVRGRYDKVKTAAQQYAAQLGMAGDPRPLLKVGDLLDSRPNQTPGAWLTDPDFAKLAADLDRCADQYQRLGQARAPLTERYGAGLWSQAEGTAAKVEETWRDAARWLAPKDDRGAILLAKQQKLRGWAADAIKRLPTWVTEIRTLEKWLAVPLPIAPGADRLPGNAGETRLDPAPHAVKHFIRLAHLCMAENAPERSWVVDEKALRAAQDLVAECKPKFASYHARRNRILQSYQETFFDLELERIAAGYAGPYQSWFRFFNGQYRRDKRALKRRSRTEWIPDTVEDDVAVGRDLMVEKRTLDEQRSARQAILGRYEKGMDTDWDAADRAVKVTVECLLILKEFDCDTPPPRFVDALCATAPPQEKIRASDKRLSESFGAWHRATLELKDLLPLDMAPAHGVGLEECAVTAVIHYAKDLQVALNQLGALTDPVLGKVKTPPADVAALVADLRQAEELRAFEATQETEAARWKERLGPGFQGMATNWDALRKTLTWTRRLRESFPQTPPDSLVRLITGDGAVPSVRDLKQAHEQYEQALHLFEHRFDAGGPLEDGRPYAEAPLETLHTHLTRLRDRAGELADWIDFRHLPDRFAHLGLGAFWERLQDESLPRDQVVDVFLKSFWSAWIEAVFQHDPALAGFRRADHERIMDEFRDLDRRLIAAGAERVAATALPSLATETLDVESAKLMREAHKKTRHLPLRRLFDEIANLLPRLKPCLLMSPLSVSQFLPADPAKMKFDVIVFDEASQILPEDALGAIYRGKQLVVTGDNRQLPPTTFFQQMADEADDDPNEPEETSTFESVLDACLGAGLPRKLLRWHYRSRHEHLIAFSNRQYYEGRLVTFPSARAEHPALGVKFHHVPDGVYDRGGRRDNPREAQVVADLVLEHFRATPDQTLGVIAFSYAQMNAIEDELERKLREAPDMEKFFGEDRLEGFFVKNLETVQGDERDVILLSVGYGKDAAGKMALNFGPLNREGGARRLNVAITRARRKLILVSSIRAHDLDAANSSAEAVRHLREYLDFAERGIAALGQPTESAAAAPATDGLHADVQDVLRSLGYQSVANVGCSAQRIDLGVVDPRDPGSFVLGIEFDGPSYHQAATARDRDRLRPEVLRQLGWTLHRIWASDWLQRRDEEIERLKKALASSTG